MTRNTMDNIIIFNEMSLVRQRISYMLQDYSIQIYKASYDVELFNLLLNRNLNFSLIIMEVGYDVEKGFEILSKINEKRSNIPVLILTSNNKKDIILRGISKGASDYILKPFDDDLLLEKILSALHKSRKKPISHIDTKSEIVFDIESYLTSEFRKAEKSKYEITSLMCTIVAPVDENDSKSAGTAGQISNLFFKKFKSISWETDLFERNGSQTFIGVFPYCGLNKMDIIKKKLMDCFDGVKNANDEFSGFNLAISSTVFPSEVTDPILLLTLLGKRMQKEIEKGNQPSSESKLLGAVSVT